MNKNNNDSNNNCRSTPIANTSNGGEKLRPSTSTSTSTSSPNSILKDYGTRYEQLLLEQRKLHSLATKYQHRRQQLSSHTTIDNTNHHDSNSANSIAGAMTANRIAMLGMLQSAIHSIHIGRPQVSDHDHFNHNHQRQRGNEINYKKQDNDENDDLSTIEGLICLWEQTLHQQQFGNCSHQQQKHQQRDEEGMDQFVHLWTLAALERTELDFTTDDVNSNLHESHHTHNRNNGNSKYNGNNHNDDLNIDDDESLNDEVDAFFETYPECQSYNKVEVYHASDYHSKNNNNNNMNNENDSDMRKKPKIKQQQQHYEDKTIHRNTNGNANNNKSTGNHSETRNNNDVNSSTIPPQVHNPYSPNRNRNQSHNLMSNTTTNHNSNSTTTALSWDAYNAKNTAQGGFQSSSGIDITNAVKEVNQFRSMNHNNNNNHHHHMNGNSNGNDYSNGQTPPNFGQQQTQKKKNPFCTANELKRQETIHLDNDDIEEEDGNPYKYQNGNNINNNNDNDDITMKNNDTNAFKYQLQPPNNPYQQQQQQDHQNKYNPNRPTLTAGLNRKFRTPKVGLGNTANQNSGGSNGRNQQSDSRQSSTSSNEQYSNGNIKNNSNKNKNDQDDDVPEALKGLDKELIAKIENEIVDSGDPITFNDIAGLEDAKQTVLELVCWPMKRPDLFTGLRRGPNGLLLFGPPGTGKTLIGKAIAHESGATFFSISSSSLTSKWIGEGEKLVRTLFAVAAYKEPSVVFIDEIDSLLTQRKADENEASRRIKTEFLVQLDGTGTSGQGRVLAIGATNRPNELDDAARRRFVKRLYIPLPEASDRVVLLKTLLSKNNHGLSEKEITKISRETKGFSGADLKALCTDAALGPIRELGVKALEVNASDVPAISYRHFRRAIKGMNPSVAESDLVLYNEWNETYGSKSISAEDYEGLSDEDDENDDK